VPLQVRDMGLLSSAVVRPATVAFGIEAYQDVWTKASALLQSLVLNRALIDGNKRLAWVAARVFLDLNGVPPVVVDEDHAEAFVIHVVTHELDTVEDVANALVALYSDGASN
jgi:death-on-curing protein